MQNEIDISGVDKVALLRELHKGQVVAGVLPESASTTV